MPYNKQRVYLIRHGETEWSVSGRHTGTTDISLTAKGKPWPSASRRCWPKRASRSCSSVLCNARGRHASSQGLGARATIDKDLCEWNYGQYEGLTPAQIRAQAPEWLIFRDGCPDGDTPAQAGARADRVIAKARASEGNIALFAHGHILRVLAARWIGLPVSEGSHFLLHTATLSVLSYYHGIGAIERWNTAVAP